MNTKNQFDVNYSTKDIMEKLEKIEIDVARVYAQATATNGKVKNNIKLIYASFGFTFACLIFLIGMIA